MTNTQNPQSDPLPPRDAPMVDIVDTFLMAIMFRNPELGYDAALYAAELQAARYAR